MKRLPQRLTTPYGILLATASLSVAYEKTVDLPIAPGGFSRASAIHEFGGRTIREGLSGRTFGSLTWDSNVTQGSNESPIDEQSDFITSAGGNVSYISEGERLLWGANLSGTYDQYFETDDLSGLNADLSLFAAYRSGRILASASSKAGRDLGINRYYGGFVEQYLFNNQFTGRYFFSSKTSLVASLSHTAALSQTEGFSDTSSLNGSLSALWSATPLIDLGPGIRYGIRSSDTEDDVTTWGPNININYQLSTKVSLRSVVGVSFVSGGNADLDEVTPNWLVALNYKASALWNADLSLYRDVLANPGFGGGVDEISAIRLGYNRNVTRFSLGTGISYEMRAADSGADNREFDYFSIDASISAPVTSNGKMIISIAYRDLSSEDILQSWSGIQTGVGFGWNF